MTELAAHFPNPAVLWRFRFGTAEFDEARFELRVAGLTVDVQRKPLEILNLLLSHAGEVVTKEELLETVWEGRPTVENVIANAMTKLRNALGEDNAGQITTQPRVGYRLMGTVERTAVGRSLSSRIELNENDLVPGRPSFQLKSLLGSSKHNEVWLARHAKTKEPRVYKFATGIERLSALKREATLSRLTFEALGPRADFVRVLDWNFEAPPFFLECEYGGESLSDWTARDNRLDGLSLADRIALFLQIADAVSAAHEVGVLHKDLKPGNVLIAPRDGAAGSERKKIDWQIRLTDFGSGRLMDPERLVEMGITQMGLTVTTGVSESDGTGTLLYLAPELIAQQPPTVKSDIYALGMMLYQLIVGDLRRPMVSGWQRHVENDVLCEDIAAATDGDPSHRLNSVAELSERLRQLDARIKQREQQRVADQESLALTEAVNRARTRRPWVVATIATLLVGVIVGTFFYYRLHLSQEALAHQNDVVRHLNTFLTRDFIGAANPANSGRSNVTVVEAARAAAKRIDSDPGSQELEVRATLHEAMQEALDGMASFKDAIDEGRKAVRDRQQLTPLDAHRVSLSKVRLSRSLTETGSFTEAKTLLDELEGDKNIADDVYLQARIHVERAVVLDTSAEWREAIVEADRARQFIAQHPGVLPDGLAEEGELTRAHAYRKVGRQQESESILRGMLAQLSSRSDVPEIRTTRVKLNLAEALARSKQFDEALQLLEESIMSLRKTMSADDPRVLRARSTIASIQHDAGRIADAEATYVELVRITRDRGVTGRSSFVVFGTNLGIIQRERGNTESAVKILREALAAARGFLPETGPRIQTLRFLIATCLLDLRQPREAPALLSGVEANVINPYINISDGAGWLLFNGGRIALQSGDPKKALVEFDAALDSLKELDPEDKEVVELRRLVNQSAAEAKNGRAQRSSPVAMVSTKPQ